MAADLGADFEQSLLPMCQCPVCTGMLNGVEPAAAAAPLFDEPAGAPLTSLPLLSSNPGATAKLFLDFDGHFEATWSFKTNVTTPAFDQDGNANDFSAGELASIQEIWARVSEDYAPFNIDVTTIDPGFVADRVVAVVAIGGSYTDWYGSGAGGVAFVGGFANFSSNIGYVFSQSLGNNTKTVAEAASHEAGHLFGLSHQSRYSGTTLVQTYHTGDGNWAPIMGNSYSADRSTWHNGTTQTSTMFQDDMAIISGASNNFGYKPDDFGSTRATASALPVSGTNVSFAGLIGRTNDQDVWSFSTTGATVSFELLGAAVGTNLDAVLEVWDSAGNVLAAHAPTNSFGASIQTTLPAGTFYLMARGEGDYGNVGRYTINGSLAATSDTTPPTAEIVDVTPDPRNSQAGQVTVTFSENVTGVNLVDFILTRDGSPVSLGGVNVSGNGTTYSLDLSAVTTAEGTYVLRLVAAGSGIVDGAGNGLAGDATDSWVIDLTAPTLDVVDVTPDPRSAAVGALSLVFSEPVTGFDIADVVLERNGSNVPLAANQLSGSGANYTLDLSSVSGSAGDYVLRVIAAGANIRDAAGNLLTSNGEDSWITDLTAPVASLGTVAPNPRNSPVGVVPISFGESVTGLDLNDFQLTRDGSPVALSGITVSGSGANYQLDLSSVTSLVGTYVLRLAAAGSGVTDAAGNLLAADAATSWVTETTAPTVDISDVSPDPRGTAVGEITITFSEPVSGLDSGDFQLLRDGSPVSLDGVPLSGSGTTYVMQLSEVTALPGSYLLRLVAAGSGIRDAAGNLLASDATDSWVTESAAPIADIVDVVPNPRNTSAGIVTVYFSEPVTGVDAADFRLSRDGSAIAIPPAALAGNGNSYTIDLTSLSGADGIYTLRLVASGSDIVDLVGNPLAGDAEDIWSVDTQSPTADLSDVSPDPRNSGVMAIHVWFSETVNGVDLADFALLRDGLPISLEGGVLSGSGSSYSLNLSAQTAAAGSYQLRLVANGSNIRDAAGNLLVADALDEWSTDTTPPSGNFGGVVPSLRNAPVGSLPLVFSELVSGLDLTDFQLTRDGLPVALPEGALSGAGQNFALDLSAASAIGGSYTLRLVAANAGIVDVANNPLSGDAAVSWVTDTIAPQADIGDIAPDPRNTAVGLVSISFSEPVSGVDVGDFSLSRNGLAVSLSGIALTGSGSQYFLDLATVTALPGDYLLSLNTAGSAIRDLAGNELASDASDAWHMDVLGFNADIVDVTPDPRNTGVDLVTITFEEPVTGVDLGDFWLTLDGVFVPLLDPILEGSGASYTLKLTDFTQSPGRYELRLVASGSGITDVGGNPLAGDAVDAWVIDTTPPTAGMLDVAPNIRRTSVGLVTVEFNEPVLGLDRNDFSLTRNGLIVPLDTVAFTSSASTATLDLTAITDSGLYQLTLNAAGSEIADLAGNAFVTYTFDSWMIDTDNPSAQILNAPAAPTNVAAGVVTVQFSETVLGFDLTDLQLWRDGSRVPLDNVSLGGFGPSYFLDLSTVTAAAGTYELRLAASGAEISDIAGNLLVSSALAQWQVDMQAPLPAAELVLISNSEFYGAAERVLLTFDEAVTGLAVDRLLLLRDGVPVSLVDAALSTAGPGFELVLPATAQAVGRFELLVRQDALFDQAGNGNPALRIGSWTTTRFNAWHNYGQPLDVDGVNGVVAKDALVVINELNGRRVSSYLTGELTALPAESQLGHLDVNDDQHITAADCLAIINYLNAQRAALEDASKAAEAEPSWFAEASPGHPAELSAELLDLLASEPSRSNPRRVGRR